jgi:hypothetical protein
MIVDFQRLPRPHRVDWDLRPALQAREKRPAVATRTLPASSYSSRFAFQHITNSDGTSNSICRKCHRIVATSHNEYSLEQVESTHICIQPTLQLVRLSH